MTRVAGHALWHEGAAFDGAGKVITSLYSVTRSGPGRAKCQCGALSEVLPSGAARRRWHAQIHKPAVRTRQT